MQNKLPVITVNKNEEKKKKKKEKRRESLEQKNGNIYKMSQALWKISTYKFTKISKPQVGKTERKLHL